MDKLEGAHMDELRGLCDLSAVGLDPVEVTRAELIHQRHGDSLYRAQCSERSYVLKWFHNPAQAIEVRGYALLEGLGVPTLPVHGRTENALLLEDLVSSPNWRLAVEADAERAETGAAVARWYRTFHALGEKLITDPDGPPPFLGRETDALNPEAVREIAAKLDIGDDPVWALAAEHVEAIVAAMRALPETLNYNDFYWTNLALSRHSAPRLEAIVYDYHLLGIGLRTSDCRNAAGSLGERAAAAFWEAYGPVDAREGILDEPMATLYGLLVAVRSPRFPDWARDCVRMVESGALESSLRRAIEIVS
jgi:hypothetical protein